MCRVRTCIHATDAHPCMLKCDVASWAFTHCTCLLHGSVRVRLSLGRGGEGGPPLQPSGWAAGQMSLPVIAGPANDCRSSDRRSEIARAHTRAQTVGPHDGAVIAPLPRADDSPACGSLADRASLCGRLAADPLPTALRAAPAARACPSPATSAPARLSTSPGMALAHSARGWGWPEGYFIAAPIL
jgi:hypothetical protein